MRTRARHWSRLGSRIAAWTALVALPALAGPEPARAQATPAAIVLHAAGEVTVVRELGDVTQRQPAAVGTRLMLGDRLEPAPGASATLIVRTGERTQVKEPTILEAPTDAEYGDLFVRAAGLLARAANTAGRSSPNTRGAVEPRPGVPIPISPRNGILVVEAQPRLTWFSVPDVSEYTVSIRAGDASPVEHRTTDTTFVIPRALAPGRTYHWWVEADDRVAPEDSLRTLSDADATGLVQGLARLRDAGFDPEGEGRLLKAVLYSDLGLHYAALAELAVLEALPAGLSAEAYLVKAEILDRVGRLDQAREAYRRADELRGS